MPTLGVETTVLEAGEITLAMPYAAAYTQQHGFVHAGILATALDSACGGAAFSLCLRTPDRGLQAQLARPGPRRPVRF